MPRDTRTRFRSAILAAALLGIGSAAAAEPAWVKDEVRVNLRTGAGRDFRILGALVTGDRVEIVSRGDGWTEVETAKGVKGWIPAGFLSDSEPAVVALRAAEAERDRLAQRVAELTEAAAALRSNGAAIEQSESEHAAGAILASRSGRQPPRIKL